MNKFDATIVLDVFRSRDTWCVYELQAQMTAGEPPETIMIGCCRLMDVYSMVEPRQNSEFHKIFISGGHVLVKIHGTTMSRPEAHRAAAEMVREAKPTPRCNLLGYSLRGARKAVICLNNGTRYETQQIAARELGISTSQISRQLRGHANSVRGFKFAYADDVSADVVRDAA